MSLLLNMEDYFYLQRLCNHVQKSSLEFFWYKNVQESAIKQEFPKYTLYYCIC